MTGTPTARPSTANPLELQFGKPIVKLLESTADARRAAVRAPPVTITPTAPHIGPALLTRRHQLRYILLIDGQPNFRPVGDLVNVTIRELPLSPRGGRWLGGALVALSCMAILSNEANWPVAAGVFTGSLAVLSVVFLVETLIGVRRK